MRSSTTRFTSTGNCCFEYNVYPTIGASIVPLFVRRNATAYPLIKIALVKTPSTIVCSPFVGKNSPMNVSDFSKSNGAVAARMPVSVYKACCVIIVVHPFVPCQDCCSPFHAVPGLLFALSCRARIVVHPFAPCQDCRGPL